MDLIYDILKKLKNYEIRAIRNHLNASPFEYEKVGKLFELVTRYKDKPEEFFSQKLYDSEPNNTFRVTKSRLKRLLEDAVLNDKSMTSYSAQYINALLQSKKRILQGEILLGRGAYKASKNLLLQAVATTRKYSLHSERFHGEFLLSRNQSINMSVREFQKRTENLLDLNRINYQVNEAAILHYSVLNVLTTQTINEESKMDEIRQQVNRIGEVAETTGSPQAQYYFFLSQILFQQYNYNYGEALEYCKKQLELVENEPAVRSKQRQGSALFQLTETSLRKGDLEEASQYVEKTLSFFSKEETNYLIVLESAFRISFYAGRYDKALGYIEKAFKHPRFEVSKLRSSRWYYFHACALFRSGNDKMALGELNSATSLLADKQGWNISFRLLEIMILHEVGYYDLLETKILNMRQFIKRTSKNSEMYRPVKLIKILMEWHKYSLDFKKTWPKIEKHLQDLQNFHSDRPFDPNSSELIRLESWMESKFNGN